eukprot:gene7355-biopygen12267
MSEALQPATNEGRVAHGVQWSEPQSSPRQGRLVEMALHVSEPVRALVDGAKCFQDPRIHITAEVRSGRRRQDSQQVDALARHTPTEQQVGNLHGRLVRSGQLWQLDYAVDESLHFENLGI